VCYGGLEVDIGRGGAGNTNLDAPLSEYKVWQLSQRLGGVAMFRINYMRPEQMPPH
jgi:hypothetical protein